MNWIFNLQSSLSTNTFPSHQHFSIFIMIFKKIVSGEIENLYDIKRNEILMFNTAWNAKMFGDKMCLSCEFCWILDFYSIENQKSYYRQGEKNNWKFYIERVNSISWNGKSPWRKSFKLNLTCLKVEKSSFKIFISVCFA